MFLAVCSEGRSYLSLMLVITDFIYCIFGAGEGGIDYGDLRTGDGD